MAPGVTLRLALVGPGGVGAAFLAQVQAYQEQRQGGGGASGLPEAEQEQAKAPRIEVVAVLNSRRMLLGTPEAPVPLGAWSAALDQGPAADMSAFLEHAQHGPGAAPGNTVVVDCTCAQGMADQYPAWARRSLHIVTPNKRAFSGPAALYQELLAARAAGDVQVLHESTVG
jgi:homoserine dehydrogenase